MAATVASGTSHNGYTLVVNRPTGTAAGDLLVAFVANDGDNVTLGAPGGWVDAGGVTGYNRTGRVFYKIATNSEPASYTFTSSSTDAYRACMVRISGAPTNNPIAQGLAWNGVNGSTTSLTTPTRTAPSGGALQLAFPSWASSGVGTIAGPAEWSTPHSTSNTDKNALIASRAVAAGAVAASTFTVSGAGTMYNHIIGTLLISSGQVLAISRAVSPTAVRSKTTIKNVFARSVSPVGTPSRVRVVVRLIARSIGGPGSTDDNFTDAFGDSFAVSGGTGGSTFGSTLIKVPQKTISRSLDSYGGYAKVTQKLLTAALSFAGTSRRTALRTFVATLTPSGVATVNNIGRLFGIPGVVDITIRLAGEIRARVRRR